MRVSILGPNAFSIRRAISSGQVSLAVEQAGQRGPGNAQHFGGAGNGQAERLDDFSPNKFARMRRVRHRVTYCAAASSASADSSSGGLAAVSPFLFFAAASSGSGGGGGT